MVEPFCYNTLWPEERFHDAGWRGYSSRCMHYSGEMSRGKFESGVNGENNPCYFLPSLQMSVLTGNYESKMGIEKVEQVGKPLCLGINNVVAIQSVHMCYYETYYWSENGEITSTNLQVCRWAFSGLPFCFPSNTCYSVNFKPYVRRDGSSRSA